jgi:hypothetical protein
MKLVLARWSHFDFVGLSQEDLVKSPKSIPIPARVSATFRAERKSLSLGSQDWLTAEWVLSDAGRRGLAASRRT